MKTQLRCTWWDVEEPESEFVVTRDSKPLSSSVLYWEVGGEVVGEK